MTEQRLTKTGSILMHEGKIYVHGFEGDDCGCSEVATRALVWAMGEIAREMVDELAKPGGSGNVCVDFWKELRQVLGIKGERPFVDCMYCEDSQECQACDIATCKDCSICLGSNHCRLCSWPPDYGDAA